MQPFLENKEAPPVYIQKGPHTPIFTGVGGALACSNCESHGNMVPQTLLSPGCICEGPMVDTNFPLTCPVVLVINSLVEVSFPVLKYGMTENTAAGFIAPHGVRL